MSITKAVFQEVRARAGYACEYCGVHEDDSGGLLTVDHFQPQSRGGTDNPANLVYACFRCNGYKQARWHHGLWNPRVEPASAHLLAGEDGLLRALTNEGEATIDALRLNRLHLVTYRRAKQRNEAKDDMLVRITEIIRLRRQTDHILQGESKDEDLLLDELYNIIAARMRLE